MGGGGGGITIRDPRRKKQNTEDYEGVGKEKEVGKIVQERQNETWNEELRQDKGKLLRDGVECVWAFPST